MGIVLTLAFLFFIGSVIGWVLELFYRNLHSHNKKWVNPGFCTGPYVPLYGFGLCTLYLLASLEQYDLIANPIGNKIALFLAMALCMTLIEYIAGIICLKLLKVRLWDYSDAWGNIQGIICPFFSAVWAVLGAIYYFFIHPYILDALYWLSQNLAFSFFVGMFFGVFFIDVAYSMQLTARLKRFAEENHVVIRYESLKQYIRMAQARTTLRFQFFRPFRADRPIAEYLKEMYSTIEKRRNQRKSK